MQEASLIYVHAALCYSVSEREDTKRGLISLIWLYLMMFFPSLLLSIIANGPINQGGGSLLYGHVGLFS